MPNEFDVPDGVYVLPADAEVTFTVPKPAAEILAMDQGPDSVTIPADRLRVEDDTIFYDPSELPESWRALVPTGFYHPISKSSGISLTSITIARPRIKRV